MLFSQDFFLYIILQKEERSCDGQVGEGIVFFFFAYKGAMDGARGGEYYKSKPRWSSGKIYTPGSPSSGLKRSILFLEISQGFLT